MLLLASGDGAPQSQHRNLTPKVSSCTLPRTVGKTPPRWACVCQSFRFSFFSIPTAKARDQVSKSVDFQHTFSTEPYSPIIIHKALACPQSGWNSPWQGPHRRRTSSRPKSIGPTTRFTPSVVHRAKMSHGSAQLPESRLISVSRQSTITHVRNA